MFCKQHPNTGNMFGIRLQKQKQKALTLKNCPYMTAILWRQNYDRENLGARILYH
jgi:hypothetical protein